MQFSTLLLSLAAASIPLVSATVGKASPYYQYGVAGSCGYYNTDAAYVVALADVLNPKTLCNKTITVKNLGGGWGNLGVGKSITATVADTLPNEPWAGHIDLSIAAYKDLAGLAPETLADGVGQFDIEWEFNN